MWPWDKEENDETEPNEQEPKDPSSRLRRLFEWLGLPVPGLLVGPQEGRQLEEVDEMEGKPQSRIDDLLLRSRNPNEPANRLRSTMRT